MPQNRVELLSARYSADCFWGLIKGATEITDSIQMGWLFDVLTFIEKSYMFRCDFAALCQRLYRISQLYPYEEIGVFTSYKLFPRFL